jgi:hypothetical protein
MDGGHFEPGSFRDPSARVLWDQGRIYRYLGPQALSNWVRLSSTRFFRKFTDDGRLIRTEQVSREAPLPEPWAAVLRHETVPVVSYPFEWSFSMLQDAAILQLDLLLAALDEGMTLKDATPFNVQWIGARPVFIDIASFKIAEPGEAWAGYRQFCEMFLYPLFLQAYKNVPFHPWLRGSLEGISARDCSRLMSTRDRLRPGVFTHVYLLSKLQSRYGGTDRNVKRDLRSVGFNTDLVKNNVRRLRRIVERLSWNQSRSTWSHYTQSNTYRQDERERKTHFVREAVASRRWPLVWDLGCNTGEYSRVAADHADCVVALDADHLAVEQLYRALKSTPGSSILPLVGDVTDPSPGLGWRGVERGTLVERARPDLILALALVHHLALSRNIPLPDLIEWFASLQADLVIEFVAPDDPMARRLLRNRDDLDFGYTKERFETCLSRHFTVMATEPLESGTRTMYHARPHNLA